MTTLERFEAPARRRPRRLLAAALRVAGGVLLALLYGELMSPTYVRLPFGG